MKRCETRRGERPKQLKYLIDRKEIGARVWVLYIMGTVLYRVGVGERSERASVES
jgi:hypothetical protein